MRCQVSTLHKTQKFHSVIREIVQQNGYGMKIILFVKIFLLLAIFSHQNEIDLSYNLQKILKYLDENIFKLEPSSIFGASLAEGLDNFSCN